jgi:hypothetical protein
MVDAPADWDGKGFACPACGGDVTVAGALASRRPDSAAEGVPEGLEIKQTPEGGFRVEYRRGNPVFGVLQAAGSLAVLGHIVYTTAQKFSEGGGSDRFVWVLAGEALGFLLLAWLFLRTTFGRRAVEFDAESVATCFQLPPLPERRRLYRAEDITALKVTTFEHAKPGDRSPRWLQVNMGKKERVLVTNLPVPQLEWLRDRIAAVIEAPGQEARG